MSALPALPVIGEAIAALRGWALDTLQALVRHPTVLGREESGQEELAGVFAQLGYRVHRERIDLSRIRSHPAFGPVEWELDGKLNLVAVHEPAVREGRSLVFNGHIDVVSPEPATLWSAPPFDPRLIHDEDGTAWLQGRGAADMKGGTVCYLWALAALQDLGLEPAARVICQSPVEEECTGNGTLALLESGWTGEACIIPEPFGETILARQVGVIWFQVRVRGRTTHVLGAGRGVNAIEKSWPIIQALRGLEEEINRPANVPPGYREVEHPLNLNVGIIRGGDWASTVAGECVTRFRLGLFPEQQLADVRRQVEKRVAGVAAEDPFLRDFPPQVEYIGFQAPGCECSLDGDLGRKLRDAHARWRGRTPVELASTATTDVRFFELYGGVPATCYGPECRDIHGVDEQVSLASMERVAGVLASFVQDWCGLRPRGGR